MKKTLTLFFLLLAGSVFCLGNPGADPWIRKQLGELNLHFNVSKENRFELVVRTFNKRDVLVTVESRALTYQGTRWRHIYSTFRFTGAEASEVMARLYRTNRTLKVGAWEIAPDNRYASCVCKIPADAGKAYLYAAISAAAEQVSLQQAELEARRQKKSRPAAKKK